MASGSVRSGAAPAGAGLGHLEIAAGRGAPALDLDAGVGNVRGTCPAWCSDSTPVMWSSTTTTSSTWPSHCWANMPMVAEPQPTRMRSSGTPLTIGGLPACDDDRGAAVDRQLDRLACAERQQRCRR